MSGNIEKSKINIEKLEDTWGSSTGIISEKLYSVLEYEIKVGQSINIELNSKSSSFVLVSGAAEFAIGDEINKLFKGDKISCSANDYPLIQVVNCGVIPLLFIKIDLM